MHDEGIRTWRGWQRRLWRLPRTLRLQLRFLFPLALALLAAAWLAVPLVDQLLARWFVRDLAIRGTLVANALSDSAGEALRARRPDRLAGLLERTAQDERLFAIAVCGPRDEMLQKTAQFPAGLDCAAARRQADREGAPFNVGGGSVHVGVHDVMAAPPPPAPVEPPAAFTLPWDPRPEPPAVAASGPLAPELVGRLVLLHDLSFVDRRSQDSRRYLLLLIAGLGLAMALITVAVAQLSWRGWVQGTRALMRGEGLLTPMLPAPELLPLATELRARLRELEDEYRRTLGGDSDWTPERLRQLLHTQLKGDQIIVVSNREPYIHVRTEAGVVVQRPASGLVTAVEPVMRACSGTWIAHGSGSADRESVDARDLVPVPPEHPEYLLRRVWMTDEEEQGYYYGFANEGLWPLCHVAHVRPVFRESDWEQYRAINRRFADAVVAEARSDDPIVLVQDYHFALVPAMVRERLPRATILTFWHIPWPNPESFGICPWQREILQGMLGSTIIGFHTRYHGRNFTDTVDRYLEARIEHEHSTIAYAGKETLVESYPISIEWPTPGRARAWPAVDECRRRVIDRLQLPADACIALGVDRFDYTKGIIERLNAVERLLDKWPAWIGRFVFVQVAAPTRSALDEYRSFQERVDRVAGRINERFSRPGYRPVHLLARHHEHDAVFELMRAADVCVVTSLHDGMNLVCKEFVAARDDLRGVLVLSRFAGAARELQEALIVNPYHVEETANALHRAAMMPADEQRVRMSSLRATVQEFNVYRWAGRMLIDAGRWRARERVEARVRRFENA